MAKKIIAVNGSPRNDCNTGVILQHFLAGAQAAGAEAKMLHLGELHFDGCRSCFGCKRKGSASMGRCAWRDELTPWLEELLHCDGMAVGSPVYFGGETGLARNFLERLLFPLLRYDKEYSTLAPKTMPVDFFYTMNVTAEQLEEFHYPQRLKLMPLFAGRIFGREDVRTHFVCDTYQFDDYGKYDVPLFDPEHKLQMRQEQFPKDCQLAYEAGFAQAKE